MSRFNSDQVAVTCEFMLGEEVVTPGCLLRIKNIYGPVLYQCLVTDMERDITYAWCMHKGKWRTFHVGHIRSIVSSKRSYRKKCKNYRQ